MRLRPHRHTSLSLITGALAVLFVSAPLGSSARARRYNAFFGDDAYFGLDEATGLPVDVFVTWNPIVRPEPAKTLRATSFARVLHDSASARELHAELDALQGHVPGLFFCGAYSVPGMGLLEEGTKSGKKAARMALEAMRA